MMCYIVKYGTSFSKSYLANFRKMTTNVSMVISNTCIIIKAYFFALLHVQKNNCYDDENDDTDADDDYEDGDKKHLMFGIFEFC